MSVWRVSSVDDADQKSTTQLGSMDSDSHQSDDNDDTNANVFIHATFDNNYDEYDNIVDDFSQNEEEQATASGSEEETNTDEHSNVFDTSHNRVEQPASNDKDGDKDRDRYLSASIDENVNENNNNNEFKVIDFNNIKQNVQKQITDLENEIKLKDTLLKEKDNINNENKKLIKEYNSKISVYQADILSYKNDINNKESFLKEKNVQWEKINNAKEDLEKRLHKQQTLTKNLVEKNNDLTQSQLMIEKSTMNKLKERIKQLNDTIQNKEDTFLNDIIKLKAALKKMKLNYDEKSEQCRKLKLDKKSLKNKVNMKDLNMEEIRSKTESIVLELQIEAANTRQENIKLKEENKLLTENKLLQDKDSVNQQNQMLIEDYENRISWYQSDISRYERDINIKESLLKEKKYRYDLLQKQLEDSDNENKKLGKEKEGLENELHTEKTLTQNLMTENQHLTNDPKYLVVEEIDKMKNNEKQYEMKLETLNNKIKNLRNENKKLQKKYNDLQAKYNDLQAQNRERVMELERYKNDEINKLRKKLSNDQDSRIEYDTKIDELNEENEWLSQKYESLQKECEQIKKENEQLIIEYDQNVLQLNEKNESKENGMNIKINELNIEIEELKKNNEKSEELNNKSKTEINALKNKLEDMCKQYNELQITTSIVEVNRKLPTLNQAIIKYQTLKDQYYADTSNLLKKYFKESDEYKDYHKYYRRQIIHQIMFESLLECFLCVKLYKINLLNDIAAKLNMKNINILDDNIDDVKDNSEADNNMTIIRSKLMNIFDSFFKSNYEYILKTESVSNEVLNKILTDKFDVIKFTTKVIESLKKYVAKCCEVIWILLLQDPPLNITPMVWNVVDQKITFKRNLHKRVLGSDKKCDTIAYYVWPSLQKENENADNNEYLQDVRIEVVLRDSLYDENFKK